MTMTLILELGRKTLEVTFFLAAPVLIVAMAVSLVINIAQVLTSMQDSTISTVPKLVVTGGAVFFLMPWLLRRLASFTVAVLSDLRPYVH